VRRPGAGLLERQLFILLSAVARFEAMAFLLDAVRFMRASVRSASSTITVFCSPPAPEMAAFAHALGFRFASARTGQLFALGVGEDEDA